MTTLHWHEIPFVRICIPFVIGILTQQNAEGCWPMLTGLILTTVFALLSLVCKSAHSRQQFRTGLICALIFSLGAFVRESAEPSTQEIHRLAATDDFLISSVQSATKTDNGLKTVVKILPPSTFERDIRIIAYLRDSSRSLLPGDTLLFCSDIEIIPAATNPYTFDFSKYYRQQGIHLHTYLDKEQILIQKSYHGPLHLIRRSAQIREEIKSVFEKYVRDAQSCAILLAMTVGIVEGINDEIYDAYAKTGTIHVLSISGLHVGIISVLLFLIIGRIRSTDKAGTKVLRVAAILTGIWVFAFIAGLSPSIMRTALMSSVYLSGICLRRPTRGLNVMAFTAFVCLCLDPFQINALSFQFSYLALAGLLIFFKPLYRLVAVRSYAGKFIWSTIVMSLAAQALLLPLLMHYFQQISLISIFSSLVAIPASYIILIGGILMLLLHFVFPVAAELIGQGMSFCIELVNRIILGMSNLPLSHLSDVYLPPGEIWLLSGIMVLVAMRLITRNKHWTYATVCGITFFGILHGYTLQQTVQNERLAVYALETGKGAVALDFISGTQCYTTLDDRQVSKYKAKEIAAFRNASRVRRSQLLSPDLNDSHSIYVFDVPTEHALTSENQGCRIVVVTNERDLPYQDILALNADWIILSSALSYKSRLALSGFLSENNQHCHDLREHGNFYLTYLKNNTTHEKQWQNISG